MAVAMLVLSEAKGGEAYNEGNNGAADNLNKGEKKCNYNFSPGIPSLPPKKKKASWFGGKQCSSGELEKGYRVGTLLRS